MSKLTIKILAKELGLSIGTVSKALRDSYEISAETKKKVLDRANELNYVPNPYASSLRRQKSKTIAVVLPEVADSFFSLAINGIESVAIDKGYHVLIYLTHESFKREEVILHDFKSGRVDGILISVSGETSTGDHIRNLVAAGVPVVFFDRVCADVTAAKVITDDYESSYKATAHLLEKGCRQIIYLSISKNLSISQSREDGFRQALADNHIKTAANNIIVCSESLEENHALIKKILQKRTKTDGIIASVEKLVPPVYRACKDLKLSIPKKIKLVGFTDLATSLILAPPLTTITQPAFEMGKAAATLLFKKIEKPALAIANEKVVIPSILNPRGSTALR